MSFEAENERLATLGAKALNDSSRPSWDWVHYDDVGEVIELDCVYDDALKKIDAFCNYAMLLAQRIADVNGYKVNVSWGKWGARLEPTKNPHLGRNQLADIASIITENPHWKFLLQSTYPFTYQQSSEENCSWYITSTA